jgi:hypothetical protein
MEEDLKYAEEQINVNSADLNTEICQKCQCPFTHEEEQKGEKLMLFETECFHTIHKACLIEIVFK